MRAPRPPFLIALGLVTLCAGATATREMDGHPSRAQRHPHFHVSWGPFPTVKPRPLRPVHSLAGRVSPEREYFIARADDICARGWLRMQRVVDHSQHQFWDQPDRQELIYRLWWDERNEERKRLRALGDPPDGRPLYELWKRYWESRNWQETLWSERVEAGDSRGALRLAVRLAAINAARDHVGRLFGLRKCSAPVSLQRVVQPPLYLPPSA
jgi:hypothetical protein